MNHLPLAATALAILAIIPACTAAPPQTAKPPVSTSATAAVDFTSQEITIIRDYYRNHDHSQAPRGKGKHKSLPPGIAKNLARGKPLPPGIAKAYLPRELVAALPPPRRGHERVIVDGRILLVEIATQVVRGVLYDVIVS
jgi:Ni/Co efflux regulator RcnB